MHFLLYLILEREVSGMANAKAIILADEDYEYLQSLTRQRTIQAQVVERAKIGSRCCKPNNCRSS